MSFSNAAPDAVTIAVTGRTGSLELYADHLVRHSSRAARVVRTHERCRAFGVSIVSTEAADAVRRDAAAVRELRRSSGVVHLTNQHLARYAPFLGRARVVVTVHDLIRLLDVDSEEPLIGRTNVRDRLLLALDAIGIRRADAVIAVSETTKRALVEQLAIPEQRITVIHQGVDHSRFRPVARRLVDDPYVLFVGSEQPRKNLRCLLEALAQLRHADTPVRLVKVGRPGSADSYRSATLRAVDELGLRGHILFTGHVRDDDLPAYYSGALCLVLPSLSEGFGLPPLEAMACRCPVVVSDAPALREVVAGAGAFFDPRSPKELAAALAKIIQDERYRTALADAGEARSAAFDWRRTAMRTEAVYDGLREAAPQVTVDAGGAQTEIAPSPASSA